MKAVEPSSHYKGLSANAKASSGGERRIYQNNVSVSSLLFPVLLLFTTGLLMIFDASSGEMVDLASGKNPFLGLFRQLVWGIGGIIAAGVAWKVGLERVIEKSAWLYGLLLLALVFVFIPGIGISANGARRWIGFHGFSIQPSEFMKVILPAYFVWYCSNHPEVFADFRSYLILVARVGAPVVLILLEPNNGTAAVIALMIGVLTIAVGIPARFWVIPLCIIALGIGTFAVSSQYVRTRLTNYLHPEADIKGKGHQPYQAKIAAGSGGVLGRGPAKSMQKLSYLPEAQNDYIAAIFAEEFGFIGVTLLLSVYLWLLHEVWKVLEYTNDGAGFCWGVSLFFLLSFQTFMNLGVVSGLLPSTGLNLPFFSQGGSSLVANSFGIGLLMSLKKKTFASE